MRVTLGCRGWSTSGALLHLYCLGVLTLLAANGEGPLSEEVHIEGLLSGRAENARKLQHRRLVFWRWDHNIDNY